MLSANQSEMDKQVAISGLCSGCHGIEGRSASPMWPALAGQDETYLRQQLKQYQSGQDGNRRLPESDQMYIIARSLSDEDIRILARHYASQKTPGVSRTEQYAEGAEIYTGKGQCNVCHGELAQGVSVLVAPSLAGQHARYLNRQLRAQRDGSRLTDNPGMLAAVKKLSDHDIEAVSLWLESISQR